jgi:hypothetical protein
LIDRIVIVDSRHPDDPFRFRLIALVPGAAMTEIKIGQAFSTFFLQRYKEQWEKFSLDLEVQLEYHATGRVWGLTPKMNFRATFQGGFMAAQIIEAD